MAVVVMRVSNAFECRLPGRGEAVVPIQLQELCHRSDLSPSFYMYVFKGFCFLR
jgi:hypothetical protein